MIERFAAQLADRLTVLRPAGEQERRAGIGMRPKIANIRRWSS